MPRIELPYVPEGMEIEMIFLKGSSDRPERRYFVASPTYNPASLFDPTLRDGRRSVIYLTEGPPQDYQISKRVTFGNIIHHQRAMKHAIRGHGKTIPFKREGISKIIVINLE